LTSDNTSNGAIAESNLTFDGDKLSITGTTSGSTYFSVNGPGGDILSISDGDNTNILEVENSNGDNIFVINDDSEITMSATLLINSVSVTGKTSTESPYIVMIFPISYSNSAFYDYFVKDTINGSYRAGSILSVWDGSDVEFSDYSTPDLGISLSGVTMDVSIVSTNVVLSMIITSGNWDLKVGLRIV